MAQYGEAAAKHDHSSVIDLIRDQNNQLTELKDQYLRLREQLQREQTEATAKLLELQRQVREEQRRAEEVEDEIVARKRMLRERHESRSVEAIEEIWQVLQAYRHDAKPLTAKRDETQLATAESMRGSTWFTTESAAAHIGAKV
jgi:chromosome segregation ATPase